MAGGAPLLLLAITVLWSGSGLCSATRYSLPPDDWSCKCLELHEGHTSSLYCSHSDDEAFICRPNVSTWGIQSDLAVVGVVAESSRLEMLGLLDSGNIETLSAVHEVSEAGQALTVQQGLLTCRAPYSGSSNVNCSTIGITLTVLDGGIVSCSSQGSCPFIGSQGPCSVSVPCQDGRCNDAVNEDHSFLPGSFSSSSSDTVGLCSCVNFAGAALLAFAGEAMTATVATVGAILAWLIKSVGAIGWAAVHFMTRLLHRLEGKHSTQKHDMHSKEKKKGDIESEISLVLGSAGDQLPQRFSYASLHQATEGFSNSKKLGAGGFGTVYEALLNEQHLAVKTLDSSSRGHGLKQFVTEIASMTSISHVHILRLCGFCIESTHRMLVLEFMPNGSLDRWLFTEGASLGWRQRIDVARGVAKGLAYLHDECREPILHLDVKPQNILLDDKFVAKVSDFGMAKLLYTRDVTRVETMVRGTPGYIAPEWMIHSIATKKCDVYSYGMVLLELLSGRRNMENNARYFPSLVAEQYREGRDLTPLVDERIIREVVEPVVEEQQQQEQEQQQQEQEEEQQQERQQQLMSFTKLFYIAFWCIQNKPSSRPSMHEVVLMLEGLKEVERPPPTGFQFLFDESITISVEDSRLGQITASELMAR